MESNKTPYLPRISWEGLQGKWEIDHLRESTNLPPGSEKIEVWRDDQYKIKAKITGTSNEPKDLLPGSGEVGIITSTFEIEGSSDYGMVDYRLEHCLLSGISYKYLENSFEADLKTYSVRRILSREWSQRVWLTEWYLNSHKSMLPYPRLVEREFKEEYRKKRESFGEDVTFEGAGMSTSDRYAFIETPEVSFVVEPVVKELGPPWSDCMSIEYREDWGGIPEADVRDAIANFVSFVIGRPLIGVGSTSFDERGQPLEQVATSPAEDNLVALCQSSEKPPIKIDIHGTSENLEGLLRRLVPNYLALKDELKLNEALWGYWLSKQLPLGGNLPELQTNLEMIMNAWFKSKGRKLSFIYMRERKFKGLLKDELVAIEKKLEGEKYKDQIMGRLRNASARPMGTNEKFELFFDEIALPIGEVENRAIKARHPMAHGSSEILDPANYQKMLNDTLSYETLFNRVLLKLLEYEGNYVDRSAKGWPERPLNQPLGGSS